MEGRLGNPLSLYFLLIFGNLREHPQTGLPPLCVTDHISSCSLTDSSQGNIPRTACTLPPISTQTTVKKSIYEAPTVCGGRTAFTPRSANFLIKILAESTFPENVLGLIPLLAYISINLCPLVSKAPALSNMSLQLFDHVLQEGINVTTLPCTHTYT